MEDEFSVIIRCKNEERWIGHTIQSVLDFIPHNEIVIVDNNSEDNSIEIANSFRRDPDLSGNNEHYTDVTIVKLSSYTPGIALNLGVKNCRYENILVISSHCVLKKFNIEELIPKLDKYAGIFANQNPLYRGKRINKRYLWKNFSDTETVDMYSDMEDRHFFHNAGAIFKREMLIKYPFNENLVGKEDRYWANNIVKNKEHTLYDPINFEIDHYYTSNGNTWKGVG